MKSSASTSTIGEIRATFRPAELALYHAVLRGPNRPPLSSFSPIARLHGRPAPIENDRNLLQRAEGRDGVEDDERVERPGRIPFEAVVPDRFARSQPIGQRAFTRQAAQI